MVDDRLGRPNVGRRSRRARKPERFSDVLSGLLRQAGMNELARFQRVAGAWRECLPEHAKSGCRLTKIDEGVLHAAVDTAALNFELSGFLKPELLKRIRQKNVGYVRDIRFKVVSRTTSSPDHDDEHGPRRRDAARERRDRGAGYNPAH